MKKIEAITILLVIVIVALLISSCNTTVDIANGKNAVSNITAETTYEKFYTAADFKGTYICRGNIYELFIEESEEYIPYISFDGNGGCTASIYYIGGITFVPGTYSVDKSSLNVEYDLKYSPVWDPEEEKQARYMDTSFTFDITDGEHITIDKGYYVVEDGDAFEKISENVRSLPPESEMKDYMGTYYCLSGQYENADVNNPSVPYVYIGKEGHCCLHIETEVGNGRDIWGTYTFDDGEIRISSLKLLYEDTEDADRDAIPHEYVFSITDIDTLTIDKDFYKVSAGDLFVRAE